MDFDADSMMSSAANNVVEALVEVPGAGVVDGMIKDFMEGGESLGNWRVTLNPASLAAIGMQAHDARALVATDDNRIFGAGMTAFGESNTQFVGGASARIGASGANGDWVGTFYGNDRADGKPESIGGAFEVSAAHAYISGAFGAHNAAE